ncbi:MAG TPA: Flp pilus assembly complex ATPase component TadA [Rhodospirillaceae bacterium]|nr:Flp pilus assembly complex ATPase component TadA [Rhodospirillaceae bacterium]
MTLLLDATLTALVRHYASPDVEEVAVNRPGEAWVKRAGGGWEARADDALSESYLLSVCRQLANVSGQLFHPERMPLLYATLPQGHRFTAVVGPGVRYDIGDQRGVAVTIRLFNPERRVSFEGYGLSAEGRLAEAAASPGHRRYRLSPLEDLLEAIAQREAILVSGATASGKTTFLNAMIRHLPTDLRLLTVEDAREVVVPHANRVHLVVSRTESGGGVDFMRVVDAVVRMTPDVIVCGEIGIGNATGVFRLMTTGHTNFMATIHAGSPAGALRAFYQNLAQANPGLDARAAVEIIASSFGRIVQIDRLGGRRVVTAIDIPDLARASLVSASGHE